MSKLATALQPAQPREQSPYERFRAQVERLRTEIASLVGKENVERFIRVCLNAVQANPDVLAPQARKSLLLACMKAAQDRLLPDGREAVFNVYNVKVEKPGGKKEWEPRVQYLPMSGGMIKKLYDSGHVKLVDAVAVNEKDYFKYRRGDDPRIEHEPYMEEDDPGKVIAAYVVVRLTNGEVKREVMPRREIEQVRLKSKNPTGLMWSEETGKDGGFYAQGAIKSVIKRAYKQLPSSYELENVIAADNATDIGLAEETAADRKHAQASSDLEALIDGRLDLEERRVPTPTPTQRKEPATVDATPTPTPATVDAGAVGVVGAETGGTVGGDPAAAVEQATSDGRPAGTPEIKAKLIASIKSTKDLELAAVVMDEANLHSWSPEDLADINREFLAKQAELSS